MRDLNDFLVILELKIFLRRTLGVDFDTGSSDLWVPVVAINGSGGHLDASKSSSFVDKKTPFVIHYG